MFRKLLLPIALVATLVLASQTKQGKQLTQQVAFTVKQQTNALSIPDSPLGVDPMVRTRVMQLLRAGRYQQLDELMSDFSAQLESGDIQEFDYYYVIAGFEVIDPSLETSLEAWHQHSNSWESRVAYANYLDAMAWQWRGGSFWHKVPELNRSNFKTLVRRAEVLLNGADSGKAKDFVSLSLRIDAANAGGEADEKPLIVDALQRFPKSKTIYGSAIRATEKRWGGDQFSRQRLVHDLDILYSGTNPDNENAQGIIDYYNGRDAFANKDYASAVQDYLKAIEKSPSSTSYYSSLASAYDRNKQPTEALQAINVVVDHWPTSRDAQLKRAKLLASLEQLEGARDSLEIALAHSPYHREVNLQALRVYGKLGEIEKAKEALERATFFTKQDPGQWGRLGFHIQNDLKDVALAKSYFNKALELRPYDVSAAYGLATIYADAESCDIVDAIHTYLTGCQLGIGSVKHQCAARRHNWGLSVVNHLQDHQRCPKVNDYDFSAF